MSDYQPTKGERAVLYGSATGSISVLVADGLPKFDSVGEWEPDSPSLTFKPYLRSGAGVVPLDRDTQDWVWQVLVEAKRLSETGQDLSVLATHHLVEGVGKRRGFLHIAPIEGAPDEDQLPVGDLT